jgi:ABC-2 type transport system ATP-binding protein
MMSEQCSPDLVLDVRSLAKWYGTRPALRDLSLEIPPGGIHAVVGRNGAGKTTLFRIVLGFVCPSAGSSRVLGADSRALPAAVRGEIAMVDEEHALPPWLSADRLCAMQRGLFPHWDQAVYDDVVDLFDLSRHQKVGQLSRGERAGVSLALALAQRPRLLILDEPTLGLDVVANQAIMESLLIASAREDCTLLFCSHQMDEVERVADHLILLERGMLGAVDAPDAFRQRFTAWTAEGLPSGDSSAEDPSAGDPSADVSLADRLDAMCGLLQHRVIEGRHHFVVIDRDASIAEELVALGATHVTSGPISFDRAVNAFLDRRSGGRTW